MNVFHVLLAASLLAGMFLVGGCDENKSTTSVNFDNSYFYGPDGKFLPEKAKDAYCAVMEHNGFPVLPGVRDKMWVSDYGTGQFTKLGLGAVMFVNDEKDRYMLQHLYLLPGQMLPEHWHEDGANGAPAKAEGWLVLGGSSHIVGEGEPNLSKDVAIPKIHCNGTATVNHEIYATTGMFVPLNRVKAHHWQFGGPDGAVISEVANLHTNLSVRHQDPALNKYFLDLVSK